MIGYSNAISSIPQKENTGNDCSNDEHWAKMIHLYVSHVVQQNEDLRTMNDECQREMEGLKIDLQNITNKKIEL